MPNKYTAEQATDAIAELDLNKLSPKEIELELKSIINQLDTTPHNTTNSATTVLYSASSIDDIVKDDNFRVLNNTEAYKFLDQKSLERNIPLINALYKAYGERPDFDNWTSQAGIFIGGDDRVTPRVAGAWDTSSANFVQSAEGNVITKIGEHADINRVFFQTELQAIKTNPNITHIDGIEKQTLFKELEDLGDPQHQINYFKTVTYAREEVAKAMKMENPLMKMKNPLELTRNQMHDYLNSNTPQAIGLSNKIDTHQIDLFTKTEVALASNTDYNKITDQEIKTFLGEDSLRSKITLDKIDNHVKELSEYNPHLKNFDISTHGKYAVVGAVAGTILGTQDADASALHLNAHLDKDKFESLSNSEKIGAEIGVGFNAINAIQAGEEFKSGASKSASTLLDTNAYKEGLTQATDAWKPSATKEVVRLGAMDSAKVAGKSLLKKLPLVGLVAGVGFGISRAMDGDFKGAGMEVASGALSLVPGWGTAGSVAMDAALLEKDTALLSHGADKLLGREGIEEERLVPSEDNHTTIPIKQDINFSNDLDQEALEQRVDPQTHQTLNLNQIQDRQSETIAKIDTTEKYKEVLADLYPHLIPHLGMTNTQESSIQKEEPNPTQDNYSSRDTNTSSDTFENNNYYVEDDFNSMPKNHRPVNLPHNSSQPLEENTFDSSAKANEIVAKMVEENGWDNDYGNSDDMGRDID